MTRCFRLNGQLDHSHVGGVAIYRDYLYVSANSHIEKYRLPMAYVPIGESWIRLPGVNSLGKPYTTSDCVDIHATNVWRVKASSFLSTTLDGGAGLLVGRWCPDEDSCHYQNGTNAIPYAYLYRLNPRGDIAPPTERCEDWVEKYRLPFDAQGVAYLPNNDELAISISTGRSSLACIWFQSVVPCPRGQGCDRDEPRWLFFHLGQNLAKGWEDLALSEGRLWTASELSALYFGPYYETTDIFYITSQAGDW